MANQSFTNEQLEQLTDEWSGTFYGRIPENQLHECFEKSAYGKGSSFAVNGHDIISAWGAMATDLQSHKSTATCIQWHNHSEPKGMRETEIAHPDGSRDIVVPCPFCRKDEFNAVYSNVIAQADEPFEHGVFGLVRVAGALKGFEVRDIFAKMKKAT